MNQAIQKVGVVLAIVAVGAGGFFLGTSQQKNQTTSMLRPNGQNDRNGNMQRLGGADGASRRQWGQQGQQGQQGRPIAGEILEKDEKSITIKLWDGSSKIVMLPDNTAIRKSTTGSKQDLKQGTSVVVTGKENSDGSVTANNVQIGIFGMR